MSTGTKIGVGVALGLVLLAVGGMAFVSVEGLRDAYRWVLHTHEVQEKLEDVLAAHLDAETGQRGFIITGEEQYLEPYNAATSRIQQDIDALTGLIHDKVAREYLQRVQDLSGTKLAELRDTIRLRKQSGFDAALPVILTDRGKKIMDELRGVVSEMKAREQMLLEERTTAAEAATNRALVALLVWMPLALVLLAAAGVLLMRTVRFGGAPALPGAGGKAWAGIAARYGAAVIIVAAAVALRSQLAESFGPMPPFVTLYPAVLLVASIGGGGPGVFATVLAALAADYWFLPPVGSFRISTPNDILALGIFTAANLGLCLLAERLRRARWAEALSIAQQERAEELSRQNEELAQQSEELSRQTEELSQQAEELSQQAEEFSRQNEELQAQSEEIQHLNAELGHREELLGRLLEAARLADSEQAAMQRVCDAGLRIFGPSAAAVMVYEKQGGQLVVRVGSGPEQADAAPDSLSVEHAFSELVIEQNRTACLNDASLRPDLSLLRVPGMAPFRAVLGAPLHRDGQAIGAVTIYSTAPQEWTAGQFRLAEWLAARCSQILEALRVRQELARVASFPTLNPNPIVEADADARVSYTNPAAERLFPDLAQRGTEHPWLAGWPALVAAGRAGERYSGREVAVGDRFYHQAIHYLPEMGRIRTYGMDITDRKRAERSLWESQNRYRELVEHANSAILRWSRDGTITFCNEFAERCFGYSATELVGKHVGILLPERESSGAALTGLVQDIVDHPERYQNNVNENVRRDGRRIWMAWTNRAIRDEHGRVREILAVGSDVTERRRANEAMRESEQRYRSLVEASAQVVWTTNARGEVDMEIPAWQALTGQTAAEARGLGWMNAIRPEDHPRVAEAWRKATESRGLYEVEYVLRRHDGAMRNILARGVPVLAADGSVRQYIGTCIDITERKRAEEELRAARNSAEQAKMVAEQANRAKDHFLAVLSHELRTPLTPVVMGVSMLQERPDLDADVQGTLEMVRRNVEMEARLIDDLLDVMRIARGKVELNRTVIEVCSVIDRAVEVCRPDIEARGLEFGVDRGPAAPYWIEADVARLQQVFWNLLKNAVKFTPHGGCVGIRCRPEGTSVAIEVNDSGIGIEAEALPRIFNAFEQAERSITRQFGGLGLGLTISKALVEMHGGTIEVESAGRNQGTTFRVRLPLAAPPGRTEAPAPAAPPVCAVRPLRILLVEDHGVTAKMMLKVLAGDGHTVETAGDVAAALELAGRHDFDLLLSDLGLPDGSGHDLMRELRLRGHKFPAVALSGYGQEEDIERSRQAGFAAHLTKPASREALARTIAAIIAGRGGEQE
jgi:PAS domain S-box-containing protein